MKIEPIKPEDVESLMPIARQSFDESFYKQAKFNDLYARALFEHAQDEGRFGVKAEVDNKIVGFFLAHLSDMGFCDYTFGMDDGFYVLPEYRKSDAFMQMFKQYKEWCSKLNIKPGVLIHYGSHNEKIFNFLEKSNFKERGRLYMEE